MLKELPNVYSNVVKVSNKKLKYTFQSDTAHYLVDSAATHGHSKL